MKALFWIAVLALGLTWRGAHEPRGEPLSPDRPIASLVPARCAVFVDGSGLAALLEQGLEHPFLRALRASPFASALLEELPLSPEAALARADLWLGSDVLALAAELGGRGLALGVAAEGKKAVLVAHGRARERVQLGLATLLDALERQLGWPGALERPQEEWNGADVWVLGESFLARRAALVVLGNDEELVRETLALAADPQGAGLLARPEFVALEAARDARATLWAWLAMEELAPHADEGFRALRAANRAPAAQALLGARLAALASARHLALGLRLDGQELELTLRGGEAPGVPLLLPLARAASVPAESTGTDLANALVYRDYARFVGQRGALFEPEVLPDFAEAITNGALFFEGRDLGEDVLATLSPWIRLVAREVEFEQERRPEIPLPALAAVAVLEDQQAGEAWASAFQSLIAVIGVDQAQKGGQSLRLTLGREGQSEISAARFSTPRPGEGVDLRYNLQPALAVTGRHLVLGTHEALVRALVRELADVEPSAGATAREALVLETDGLRRLLQQNLAYLVARKMLEDGLEHEAAAREVDGLQRALDSFEGLRLELGADDAATPTARLVLSFARPEEPR